MSEFPLNIEEKEDHPSKVAKLATVPSKFYERAKELNKKTRALEELYVLIGEKLGINSQAKDSEKLGGNAPAYYLAKTLFDTHSQDTTKHITPQERDAWNGDIPISRITDLQAFINSVNTLLASDDVTLDELQEIVTYIKQNKSDLQDLSVPNIAGLEDALASKITKNETGDENKFFNEKGLAVEIPPQLQADFNQTDNTKPDYINGFPLSVLDHNGAKKFDAKEIQFDMNFDFNPAENEIIFKSNLYQAKISSNSAQSTSVLSNVVVNSEAVTPESPLWYVGKIFDHPSLEPLPKKTIEIKSYLREYLLTRSDFVNDPISGIIEFRLLPKNALVYRGNDLEYFVIMRKELTDFSKFEKHSQIIINNIIQGVYYNSSGTTFSAVDYFLSTLDDDNNIKNQEKLLLIFKSMAGDFIDLKDIEFDISLMVSLNYASPNNSNNNNNSVLMRAQNINTYVTPLI